MVSVTGFGMVKIPQEEPTKPNNEAGPVNFENMKTYRKRVKTCPKNVTVLWVVERIFQLRSQQSSSIPFGLA